MEQRLKKIALSVVTFILALLAAEGATRLLFSRKDFKAWQAASLRYHADPCFGWKILPGEYFQSRETIRINRLGLRGPELSEAKAPGEMRVFVLGGSAVFNNNSAGGNTWPRLLERRLHERFGPFVRVVNAGTPGYSTYQSAKRLECELLRYSPDLVLIYHLWNDVKYFSESDIPALVRLLEEHGRFNQRTTLNIFTGEIPIFDRLTEWSQIAARLRFAFIKLVRHINKYDDEGKTREKLNELVHSNGVDFYRRNLLAIRSALAQRNIPLIIVKQGTLAGPNNTPRERELIGYRYPGFNHEILLEAYRKGWEVNDEICRMGGVSCIPAHERLPHTLEYFRDHVHLTDRGKKRLADTIFEEMEKMKWVAEKLEAVRSR